MDTDKAAAQKFNATLGATIKSEAAYANKIIAQLSRETGIEYVTLGRYIRGERDIPVTALYRCSLHLNLTVDQLVRAALHRIKHD